MGADTSRLGEEKISRLLWQFSLPSIMSAIAGSAYVIIDRIFVGQMVGAQAIAGISLTMPISFIILAFVMLVAAGSGTLVSIRLGEGRQDEAEAILGNAVTLIGIISIVTTGLLLILIDKILIALGGSPAILPYATEFIRIILLGSVFQYIVSALPAIIRAEGDPRTSMNIVLINVGVNIFLDFVFIYLLGWAVKGVAIATVMAQTASSVFAFWYFCGPKSVLRLRARNLPIRLEIVKEMMSVGMAPFVMQMAASIVYSLFNQNLARYGGDTAIGAYGIINVMLVFLILPVNGIIMGVQPIIGFNYGAGRYDRVIEALKDAIIAATVVTSTGFIILQLFPGQLLGVFTDNSSFLTVGSRGMRLMIIMLPVIGFQMVSSSFFQAIGKARTALGLALLRQVLILIPALIILPRFFHLNGIWIASPLSDGLAVIVTILVLSVKVRSLKMESNIITNTGKVFIQ
ncbi:MAG: MATE family efflux transporter [Syntrophomonas sp.]